MTVTGVDREVAVLAYHRLGDPPPGPWNDWFYVPEEAFAEHLGVLAAKGWPVITMSDLLAGLVDPTVLPCRSAVITFDDADVTLVAVGLPQLRRFGAPAVVFVPTGFIAATNGFDAGDQPPERICGWPELHELARHGVSVQAHSVSHRRFTDLAPSEIRRELASSKRDLEDRLGHAVEAFAYPFGDIGSDPDTTEHLLQEAGYRAAFLYGGACPWPATGSPRFRLGRIPMGRDTELEATLAGVVGAGA